LKSPFRAGLSCPAVLNTHRSVAAVWEELSAIATFMKFDTRQPQRLGIFSRLAD
jgi:hypothetical protein